MFGAVGGDLDGAGVGALLVGTGVLAFVPVRSVPAEGVNRIGVTGRLEP